MKTILWIHGFNCSLKIFGHLQANLPKHKSIDAEYNSFLSVDTAVADILEQIPRKTPVTIVGHSLGGIIGYLLAARSPDNIRIENLVTISTPFGGSDVASKLKWFYPSIKVFSDLTPKSESLQEVQKTPLSIPFLSIVSITGNFPVIREKNDGVVTIKSQRAIKATRSVDVEANHFEAVQDAKTLSELKNFIF